ncbi:hypothetical protein DVA67_032835 [Solirubrobacter sp. CPCC 204708]|uniref:Uncharacterized protein n=1 Tax=Solirubrobacter deserti TaxID=2282478 RepID=A0ABT4RIP5_9ACTN|nr:hypothetical protein [Solirubrobacter deserti]MBE2320792.1 hypothetical protein [Solirubrobacter deserti]MDA0138427.1 hypothetical protein [Solirubrobacter deserti]
MSDVPELRALVREVAERRARRRRTTLGLRLVAVPAVAAAAFAYVAGGDRRSDERPVVAGPTTTATATPAPNPFTPNRRDPSTPPATLAQARAQAEAAFGLFRRAARASDQPASRLKPRFVVPQQPDWDRARLVKQRGDVREFVMPGLWDGIPGLCTVGQRGQRTLGVICNPGFPRVDFPSWTRTTHREGPIYLLLFPDGVERVTLHLKSGKTVEKRVRGNVLEFQQRGLHEIVWRDASGTEYRKRLVI